MYLENEDYIDSLGIHTDCVVINQCDRQERRTVDHATPKGDIKVTYIESTDRGLSRSRNAALDAAEEDIVILCDNDVEYEDDYDRTICDAFERFDADVCVFFVERPERHEPVFNTVRKMGYLSVLKIFSPEIAFRRSAVGDIRFNEMFGAGAKYYMGEENLFLYECLKRGKKILYIPRKIAKVREEESTWFHGYDRDFFISRGANYAAMSRPFSVLLILQFAVRKRALYSGNISTGQALSAMFSGRRQYLDIIGKGK